MTTSLMLQKMKKKLKVMKLDLVDKQRKDVWKEECEKWRYNNRLKDSCGEKMFEE